MMVVLVSQEVPKLLILLAFIARVVVAKITLERLQ